MTESGSDSFPVSVKAVIFDDHRVLLVRNDRSEWELPGGKLEFNESPTECVEREVREETGWTISASKILDSWNYRFSESNQVLIVTYGCEVLKRTEVLKSPEGSELTLMALTDLSGANLHTGYRHSIEHWASQSPRT
jgi:8-oxo-dGTP pyrophosphatase MutT (NUDIX family)